MKLLIVDDQIAAARALATRNNWSQIGFEEVCAAQNAMEARGCFRDGAPDVMLCDIEMPVESGIELCHWVRSRGFATELILLTCHSDFKYAQEAIGFAAFDYIVQPAPYELIYRTVRKAVEAIQEKREASAETKKQKDQLSIAMWSRFLRGDSTIRIEKYLGESETEKTCTYIILLQTVRWSSIQEQWQGDLMCSALTSLMGDILPASGCRAYVIYMERNVYAIVVRARDEQVLSAKTLEQVLEYLCDFFKIYMPCTVACYPSSPVLITGLPTAWEKLCRRKDRNVSGKDGVFSAGGDMEADAEEDVSGWKSLLQGHNPRRMEKETLAFLDEWVSKGAMTDTVLRQLYFSFVQFLHDAGSYGNMLERIFADTAACELYLNAVKSVEGMKALIRYVAQLFESLNAQNSLAEKTVQTIREYVEQHLAEDIRVEDIAAAVHLSANHITRLFRREQGCSIKSYIIQRKMYTANNLLRTTTMPISVVAAKLGYTNFSHFSTAYKKVMGYAPSEHRDD